MSEEVKKTGRPLKFKTPEELENRVQEYWKYAEDNKKPFIIAKLAYFLDCSRDTLYEYKNNGKDGYSDIIKKAIDRCMAELEEGLIEGKTNPAGKIFIAKNYGYSDKQEIEHTGDVNITLSGQAQEWGK